MRRGRDTTPSSGVSSPAMILKSVVLPEPFGPTSPTFSPGLSWKDASTKSSCLPVLLGQALNGDHRAGDPGSRLRTAASTALLVFDR